LQSTASAAANADACAIAYADAADHINQRIAQ